MAAVAAMAAMAALPAEVNRRLAQVLREVDDTDLLWLQEIRELADQMFSSHCNNEPELIPKTPSQKKRQRRRRLSTLQDEQHGPCRKRLSRKRSSRLKLVPSRQHSQELHNKESLELLRAALKDASPPQRVTRSQAAASAKRSEAVPETPLVLQAEGKIPVIEIQVSDRTSAELHLQKSKAKPAELSSAVLSSGDDSPTKGRAVKSPPAPAAPEPVVPQTPEANGAGESEAVSRQKTAKAADATVILSDEPGLEVADDAAQVEEAADKEPSQRLRDSPGTPTGSRLSRRSVRRSLMGKTSLTRRTSLAEKYSLASKRRSMTRRSAASTQVKKAARKSSVSSSPTDVSSSAEVPEDEETVVNAGPPPGPSTPSKPNPQSPQMSLRSQTANRNKEPQETSSNENNLHKNEVTQEPPQSARRKPSYKRAVDERYDIQQAQDGGLSPPRKKVPSPAFPASKVVRPFKTFLHTVQKNQLLMTPTSVGRHGVIKSFIKYNTPDPKEKERQKLETLRKKQEAEQLRKQKLEEEKKRRLEEAKLKREERLRKVLQTRERAEQIEEERKRRIEQKIALSEEKTEKVREERLAEEKIKKKAAAKKLEEAEARRRQEEEARRQRALQQEEEERRHRELVQKRKEEEQERARKAAEQRQAEQERERQLAAERELEKKKEQERIQAEKLREQQERAARLQKAVLAAEQQLHRETEKKQEQQRLAEVKRQEQEQKKLLEQQKAKDLAQAQHPGNKEILPGSESYQMTPQSRKAPKPLAVNTADNYGMDLNSDDSTDDESHPRKPIPAWATGSQLRQAVLQQYRHPPSLRALFGAIAVPRLESIFRKSKPRYFKRTSSAVWSSPPFPGARPALALPHAPRK
ncbi:inner centromere protein isoform X2 [Patagioenas fasciata]|uniref:inner centromere protein isoform X2 n=1 Tax=Patagioenas fasciata TaxID=372321 RepID=UPI0032E87127